MKKLLILSLLFFLTSSFLIGQSSLSAKYSVTQPISISGEGGKPIAMILNYEGRIFHQSSKVLLYMRPLFLDEYPEGKITITYPGGFSTYTFSKDSMYLPELYDTDSLRKWAGYNNSNSKLNEYITFKYNPPYWKWQILPETKIINGFNCQNAKYYYPNKTTEADVFWDIWFSKDIPFAFSFMSLQNAPGLVVEAENRQANYSFSLKSLQIDTQIPSDTFWPPMFKDAKFTDLGTPQTPQQKKVIKKQDKMLDIMVQQ